MAPCLLLHEATSFFSRPVRRKQSACKSCLCTWGAVSWPPYLPSPPEFSLCVSVRPLPGDTSVEFNARVIEESGSFATDTHEMEAVRKPAVERARQHLASDLAVEHISSVYTLDKACSE